MASGQKKSRYANVVEGDEEEALGDFAFMASQNQSTKSTTWYFDSGASRHYTCHKDWYVNFIEDKSHSESVFLGDDWNYYIRGCGDVRVILNNSLSYTFKNVQYVLDMNKNILSIGEITKKSNLFVNFQGNKCMVSSLHDNKVIAVGISEKGLYKV